MAFMNQEKKKLLAPAIKAALKKYGLKGSIAVNNYSSLVVNIRSGKLDLIGNYNEVATSKPNRDYYPSGYLSVNDYWIEEQFTGDCLAFLSELVPAMNDGNHDRSDAMIDYFDVGWYTDINIGQWDKDYVCTKEKEEVL